MKSGGIEDEIDGRMLAFQAMGHGGPSSDERREQRNDDHQRPVAVHDHGEQCDYPRRGPSEVDTPGDPKARQ